MSAAALAPATCSTLYVLEAAGSGRDGSTTTRCTTLLGLAVPDYGGMWLVVPLLILSSLWYVLLMRRSGPSARRLVT